MVVVFGCSVIYDCTGAVMAADGCCGAVAPMPCTHCPARPGSQPVGLVQVSTVPGGWVMPAL